MKIINQKLMQACSQKQSKFILTQDAVFLEEPIKFWVEASCS